ncbi:hypothetical protein [Pengzhenrongella sp.]|jgi:hypothetical protein|uniref:hypothetical protein n=1 Tax=Pengzhenrongella sp. TaxID=2888820 RepID=UPI002F92E613
MSDVDVRLDHRRIVEADLDWLAGVRRLTLWAVKLPPGLLARLPALEFLDVRGGTGTSADFVAGCTRLRVLVVNQVRGMIDVSAIGQLQSLELLSLYGLPRVTALPRARRLAALRRVELGSMKGLTGLDPVLEAPNLSELQLIRSVYLSKNDVTAIRDHPTLQAFGWLAENVPGKTWMPVVEAIDKPKPALFRPEHWLDMT